MKFVEISPIENGAHRNQTSSNIHLTDGWAVVPDELETENFPFGNITVQEVDGVMTVTSWEPIPIPESQPEHEAESSVEERVTALEETTAEMAAAILEGVNEV